ncbi:hypothetical protein K227x_16420 [Rubripirellula lacrimiformis]|uniref:Uncharacterized protein n=1 Tax=Rubripirellula lacrimiformis TaxID=1930273 RepID=A0A517N820_9BACT|nr:hypothetical protein [Rubripirellula lacrimiformis]QDT03260.1 hypothetical protein K227x_16420 [Rubripirellula lacrimiformis]
MLSRSLLIFGLAIGGTITPLIPPSLGTARADDPVAAQDPGPDGEGSAPLSPAPASPVDLKSDVLQWVEELDANRLTKRKSAERALIAAGPDALPYLPETKPGISIEAAERLSRVRKTLMKMRTEDEAESDAFTVSLADVSNLGEALEAISRDSGVEFDHEADSSLAISPVAAPLGFWHAVDLVLDQSNLDINFYGGDESTLKLVGRNPDRPSRVDSAAYAGVYRIEPTAVTSRRSLNNPTLSGLNISVEIAWQPRVTPIGLTLPIKQLSAKLDDGADLEPQETGETIDVATNSDIAFSEFFFPMELPAGQPSKIESLSGQIRALLPGKKQQFELPLISPGTPKTIDAMTVEVESVRPNGPLHEIRVAVELTDADRSLESHRHWIYENDVYAQRKDGSRADHLGYEVYRQTASGVGIGYLFDLGDSSAAAEATLIYQSPTAVVPSEVSFVIQDIPLP